METGRRERERERDRDRVRDGDRERQRETETETETETEIEREREDRERERETHTHTHTHTRQRKRETKNEISPVLMAFPKRLQWTTGTDPSLPSEICGFMPSNNPSFPSRRPLSFEGVSPTKITTYYFGVAKDSQCLQRRAAPKELDKWTVPSMPKGLRLEKETLFPRNVFLRVFFFFYIDPKTRAQRQQQVQRNLSKRWTQREHASWKLSTQG